MAKILLVEDDKSLREIYGVRLQAEGYTIVSAGDGEEALALAIKEKPDLILSDVMMPKISGFDMLDILRSTGETKNVKVIMMTALSSEDQRARGESLGANKYLVKSQVGIEDVVRSVREVLESDPATEAEPAPNDATAPAVEPQATPAPESSFQPVEMPAAQVTTQPEVAPQPVAPNFELPSAPTPMPAPTMVPPQPQPVEPLVPTEPAPASIYTTLDPEEEPAPMQEPIAQPAPMPEISAPDPIPLPTTVPDFSSTPVATPEPEVQTESELPQPLAPFSSPAPASLGNQITQPEITTVEAPAPALAQEPIPAPTPITMPAEPAPASIYTTLDPEEEPVPVQAPIAQPAPLTQPQAVPMPPLPPLPEAQPIAEPQKPELPPQPKFELPVPPAESNVAADLEAQIASELAQEQPLQPAPMPPQAPLS